MQALELKEAMHATDAIINLELQETKMEEVPTEIAATTPLFVQEEEIVNEEAPLHFELFIKDEVGQQENALPTLEEEQLATDGITLHYKQDADADNVHSIGFLNKPSNIYNDNNVPAPAPVQPTLHEAPVFNFDTAPKPNVIEEETLSAQPIVQQEELPAVDEAEEGRRRAQERIMRLRNLSFTPGELADEYDNVPAFMRRNVDISGNNGPENFYSNTTVKVDENNNTQISTINHFLDGKKPD
jgi:cell division protein FtsZ